MKRVTVYALSAAALLSLGTESIVSAREPLIWEDQFDLAGRPDQAFGITVSSRMAVAIGVGGTALGGTDLLMRAYNVRTGTLEWHDQRPLASGVMTKVVIDDVANKVFGAGYAANGPGTDFLVRAYDARTGDRLWEDVVDKGRDDFVQDIAAGRMECLLLDMGETLAAPPSTSWYAPTIREQETFSGRIKSTSGANDVAAWQVETEGGTRFGCWVQGPRFRSRANAQGI